VRTTAHVVELSHRLGVPHFVTTGHPSITAQQYDTVFRTFYTTSERAEAMVQFMKERLAKRPSAQGRGPGRIAVIASTSAFGKFYADAVERMAPPCEVLRIDFDPDVVKDFRPDLQRIKAWGPDFVLNLGIIARDSAYEIINQAGALGLCPEVPMFVGIPFPSAASDFWRRVGANGAGVTWASTAFRPGCKELTPIGRWFVDHYAQRYGGFPSEMALTAFTDVTIIAQALARAQTPTRRGLIDSLESGSFDSWRGPISFARGVDHWHHSSAPVQLMQYQGVGDPLERAAIVYPPELQTHPFLPGGSRPVEAAVAHA
jgi:branched-chain amino acid transport system substrate-binding protein